MGGKALADLDAFPETKREEACRLLAEAWEKSGETYLAEVGEKIGSSIRIAWMSAGDIISSCKAYLHPAPLTDAEKLAKLREAAEKVTKATNATSIGGVMALIKVLEETK